MNIPKYLKTVQYINKKNGVKLSDKVLQAYQNPKYFNKSLLSEIPPEKLNENLNVITSDLVKLVKTRNKLTMKSKISGRKRKHSVSYPEVLNVIEKRFCSLPPFCKNKSSPD